MGAIAKYTDADFEKMRDMRRNQHSWKEISMAYCGTVDNVNTLRTSYSIWKSRDGDKSIFTKIDESPYPQYNKPLIHDGDALVLADPEVPFHHADFINRCLELAGKWKIDHCTIAGDVVHLNAFSHWEPNWLGDDAKEGMSDRAEQMIMDAVMELPAEYQGGLLEVLGEIPNTIDSSAGAEMEASGKVLVDLAQQFETMDYVIGNHDGRFLRTLNSEIFPSQLLQMLGIMDPENSDPKWHIGPYYFSIINSGKRKFRVEHPKSAAKTTASILASKYLCNTIVGHAHQLQWGFDRSGTFYAIMAGCCVDEERLPYAAQRSTNADKHKLGAVILRDGYPYVLHEETQWKRMAKM